MNAKKDLRNRIRGWLPRAPTMPNHRNNTPIAPNTIVLSKPMPIILDYKFYRNGGIMIGLGIGLVLAGFLGWLTVSSTYSELQRILSYNGQNASNFYFFTDLTNQIAIYLTLSAIGAITILWSVLILKNRWVRNLFFTNNKAHSRLGNGLIGGGGALALGSIRFLFVYLLTSEQIQLDLFVPSFLIGTILVACGILALRQTK